MLKKVLISSLLILGMFNISGTNAGDFIEKEFNCNSITNNLNKYSDFNKINKYSDFKDRIDNFFKKISLKDITTKNNYFTKINEITEKYLDKIDQNKQKKLYTIIGYIKCENDSILGEGRNNEITDKFVLDKYNDLVSKNKNFELGKYLGDIKVVENDYVKAIVAGDVWVTYNTIYEGGSPLATFWEIPNGITGEEFITKHFIDENYKGKCIINSSISKRDGKKAFSISAYGEYKKELEEKGGASWMGACGYYGQTNSVQYFKLLDNNILMFVRAGQEPGPVNYQTITAKKDILISPDKIIKNYGNGIISKIRGNKNLLFKNETLLYIGYIINIKVEQGKNGEYILIQGENGDSTFFQFDKVGIIKFGKFGNSDLGIGKTIKTFELMLNKKVKLFYIDGTNEIIDIK